MKKLFVSVFAVWSTTQLLGMELTESLNQQIQSKLNQLYWFNTENCLDEVVHLIELGGNPNLQDHHKSTPLHIACAQSRVNIVKILLQRGADIRIKNIWDLEPLYLAQLVQNREIINLLEEHKKIIDNKVVIRHTPMYLD